MIFKPWNKDIEQIFERLSRNGKAFVKDINITRTIGRMYPEIKPFIKIYRNNEEMESVILPMDDVFIVPKKSNSKFKKFEIYRIF